MLVLAGLGLLLAVVCVPAYFYSRRNGTESVLLPVVWLPSLVVWFSLTVGGIGAQSLGNLVEVVCLVGGGVLLTYLKVLVVDRGLRRPRVTTLALAILLMVAAAAMRLLMPIVPE